MKKDTAKVVIVEDNAGIVDLFESWLSDSYLVEIAVDCAAAEEMLDETVDVVLLDRHLPDGTGDDILATIRNRGLECRVAMVTGVKPTTDIVKMGFDDYLCKPVTREELLETVARLVAQSAYSERLTAMYAVASKLAVLESNVPSATLEASEEYAALQARYDELDAENANRAESFTDTQFTAEFSRVVPADD